MANDFYKKASNEQLIAAYEKIGDKLNENQFYELLMSEHKVVSSMSKRKLIHKSRYKRGLPKTWNAIRLKLGLPLQ